MDILIISKKDIGKYRYSYYLYKEEGVKRIYDGKFVFILIQP